MIKNKTSGNVLTGEKFKALEALLTCDTIDKPFKDSGITRSTMYRYMKDDVFNNELKLAKRQLINRAVLRLQQTCGDATRALAEICRNKDAPASARVSAAREILSSALEAVEIENIEGRLKSLEEKLLFN